MANGDSPSDAVIRPLDAGETERRLGELAEILVDAVAGGAGVNFMADLAPAAALAFWRGQVPGIAEGERVLLVAEQGGRLVGTVVLAFAPQPNAPHRAEIGKMLVHSGARRRGLGRRLLDAAEGEARAAGRTLLMLDTVQGSAGDKLYRACGWIEYGVVPDHARLPDGPLSATTFFYKRL